MSKVVNGTDVYVSGYKKVVNGKTVHVKPYFRDKHRRRRYH